MELAFATVTSLVFHATDHGMTVPETAPATVSAYTASAHVSGVILESTALTTSNRVLMTAVTTVSASVGSVSVNMNTLVLIAARPACTTVAVAETALTGFVTAKLDSQVMLAKWKRGAQMTATSRERVLKASAHAMADGRAMIVRLRVEMITPKHQIVAVPRCSTVVAMVSASLTRGQRNLSVIVSLNSAVLTAPEMWPRTA